jgi:hypothetical protein
MKKIVDDILADIVTIIVRDIRQQRKRNSKQRINNSKTNGYSNHKQQTNGLPKSIQKHQHKTTNGKHHSNELIPTNR